MGFVKEFREFAHRELRSEIEYEITLGPAHVTNLDWLLQAMFAEVMFGMISSSAPSVQRP